MIERKCVEGFEKKNHQNYQRLVHSGQKVWRGAGTLKTKKIRHSCVAELLFFFSGLFRGRGGHVQWMCSCWSTGEVTTNKVVCSKWNKYYSLFWEKKDNYRKWLLLRHSKFHHQPHHFRIFKNKLSKHTEITNLTR